MKLELFAKFVESYVNGSYVKMEWKSVKKTLKAHKSDIVEKVSVGVNRLGIEYSNLSSVNRPSQGLAYGEFMENLEKFIIEYKGTYYLRVYPSKSSSHKITSVYYLNGEPTTKEYLIENGICSESALKGSTDELDCFNIKLDNLISIN
jgi:hypothetical protein